MDNNSRIKSLRERVAKLQHPIVMAFGNPLLDVYVMSNDDDDVGEVDNCCSSLLNKYNLKIDGQTELDRKEMDQLLCDLPNKLKKTAAGGCALNTVRILQELCDEKNRREPNSSTCVYYGGLGNDSGARTLSELVKTANIDARYAVHPSLPTGICVSIVSGSYRSLAANLGAAAVYTLQDLNKTDLPLDSVKIIYIEGFFIVHSLDVAKEVVKRAQEKKIIVAFNLNGTYVFEKHAKAICEMVGLSNIIFGNVEEMVALAKSLDLRYNDSADIPFILNNLKRVTVNASNSCSNDWLASDSGIIVMTQGGSKPATVVWGQGSHASCAPIKPLCVESAERCCRIQLDTTGAGDSLVSGFLFGLITGQHPETCLKWGCKVAAKVITKVGATLFAASPAAAAAANDDDNLPDDFLR